MSKMTIGIDPDSKKHGVAVYIDGVLTSLYMKNLLELMVYLKQAKTTFDIVINIEDVCGLNAVFRQRQKGNGAVNMKMANSVGKCQQSQIELERLFEHLELKVVKYKISKSWKDQNGKKIFEKVTGWEGKSNEDTRSAAYFGYLGLNKSSRSC